MIQKNTTTTDTEIQNTILVVDDEPVMLGILISELEGLYRVKVANSGARALEVVMMSDLPDLILLDVNMEGVDGFEVCRRLKATPRTQDIPVVFLTIESKTEKIIEGLSLGAIDYILKPPVPIVLHKRIASILSTVNQKRELSELAQEKTQVLEATRQKIIQSLGVVSKFREPDAKRSLKQISEISQLLARRSGMPDAWSRLIYQVAPLYDIGKISIPDEVLFSKESLTDEQRAIVERHVVVGAEIIGDPEDIDLFKMARNIARYHQEHWDGQGYAEGLRGSAIPLEARILAISHTYDALVSERPYRTALTAQEAIAHIQELSGTQFDPDLVRLFVEMSFYLTLPLDSEFNWSDV